MKFLYNAELSKNSVQVVVMSSVSRGVSSNPLSENKFIY
jgi:hypothetical protein